MALWDLAGKAYGVPVYQMLDGRTGTACASTATRRIRKIQGFMRGVCRAESKGYTALKMDIGISLTEDVHGALVNRSDGPLQPWEHELVDYNWTEHSFTQVQVTQKGIDKPIVEDGYVTVPEQPGIGVDLNEDLVEEYLVEDGELFAPTPEWNESNS